MKDNKSPSPLKHIDLEIIDPKHYTQFTIEPIHVIEDWNLGFNEGNAIKYIARSSFKSTLKADLLKAANYLYRQATGKWLPKDLFDEQ